MIAEELHVLVGDANGSDRAIQAYLAQREYQNVTVYFSGTTCRNNLGNWQTRCVSVDRRKRDFSFYVAKDIAMSEDADYGFMVWDGESQGTLNNVLNLLERGKKVVMYISPDREFLTFRTPNDAGELLRRLDVDAAEALDRKIGLRRRIAASQGSLSLT
jgi:hypothetical protein